MVKFIFALFLVFNISFASPLSIAKSFVSPSLYNQKQEMFNAIFLKSENFINPDTLQIDRLKILKTLKQNGLLNLNYQHKRKNIVRFDTRGNPILALRLIDDVLEDMGYTDFLKKSVSKHGDRLSFSVELFSESLVDPIEFSNKLKNLSCVVEKVERNGETHWDYDINLEKAKLKTIDIGVNERVKLNKPNRPYWFIVHGAKNADITSHISDNWYPKVTFFDKFLHPLSQIKSQTKEVELNIDIPENAYYMEVEDKFKLDNIKRGITLILR